LKLQFVQLLSSFAFNFNLRRYNSASVNFGYALGGVIVGVGYTSMGWVGLNVLSAVVAAVGLVLVATLATPPAAAPAAPAAPGPATDTPAVAEAAAAPGGMACLDTDMPLGGKPAAAVAEGPNTYVPARGMAVGGAFTVTRPGGKPAAAVAAAGVKAGAAVEAENLAVTEGVGAGTAVAAGSLAVTKPRPPPPPPPDEGSVWRAYCSGAMISHMYTAFNVGRGLHSSTFQPNLSALHGIGGARRGYVARTRGMFRVCRVLLCVRHGLSRKVNECKPLNVGYQFMGTVVTFVLIAKQVMGWSAGAYTRPLLGST